MVRRIGPLSSSTDQIGPHDGHVRSSDIDELALNTWLSGIEIKISVIIIVNVPVCTYICKTYTEFI